MPHAPVKPWQLALLTICALIATGCSAVCVATRRNRLPSTVATAQAQPADPLADVFGQCTAEVQELVRAADDHASDVQALIDSWPR